jgi:DNA polymerase I-like protein with 3'-5' exonuclease and polymerase domains
VRLLYDIETDGLLEPRDGSAPCSKVHCIVAKDLDRDRVYAFHNDVGIAPRDGGLTVGVEMIANASERRGHNIVGFDDRVLEKLYNVRLPCETARDTRLGASVCWPSEHLKSEDFARLAHKPDCLPKPLIGRHSLEAWGYRLGEYKGAFAKTSDWKAFTQPMLTYCMQDVNVTARLNRLLERRIADGLFSDKSWVLEQQFYLELEEQMRNGVGFDMEAAERLVPRLLARKLELAGAVRGHFKDFVEHYVTPKQQLKKTRVIEFNPGSHAHIGRGLVEQYGWKPAAFGADGHPTTDEATLTGLKFPPIKDLIEYLLVQKRLGALAEGKNAWVAMAKDGRIRGTILHNAAVTSRCTHSKPNLTGVPSVETDRATKAIVWGPAGNWGADCRALFVPFPGEVLVGFDASGLELRMLAHYLARYDGGQYIKVVTTGDVHEFNRAAANIGTRDEAKVFIYAYLYGAGDAKIAGMLKCTTRAAKAIKKKFTAGLSGLSELKSAIREAVRTRQMVRGLDGRYLHVRQEYSALNTLLQGGGAVVMKQAVVNYTADLRARGVPFRQVIMAHDECQVSTPIEYAEIVGKSGVQGIRDAGHGLKVRCPLDGVFKIGRSWAETH